MVASEESNEEFTICNNSGYSHSLWMDVPIQSFSHLERDLNTDICIVGGGIAGLTCAYTLAKKGKSVVILDQGVIGGGQTARTSAHLSWILNDRYYELEKIFGEEGAQLAAQSHSSAIGYIEKIIFDEKIDCDFERVNGYLFVAPEDSNEILEKEYLAIKNIGMLVDKVSRAPFSPTFDTGPCLHFPNQGKFHVLKYIQGLVAAILKYGGKIYSNTHVNHFEDGTPCTIKTTSGFTVKSQSIIVATCSPVNDRFYIHTKQSAYRTYVIAASIPAGTVPNGLYWDTLEAYHYIRIQKNLTDPNLEWLLVGGEDHKTGQCQEINEKYDHLEKWTRLRFPMVDKIGYCWSGQVFNPVDTLAYIGLNPGDKNIYIATGDSGNGMTHGTIAGILLPDLILGNNNPWKKLYDPFRKSMATIAEYVSENFNNLIQLKDWFTPGEFKTVDNLGMEEGIIIREGVKKIAVYKDSQNKIHIHSAFCPHLGGCLRWNQGEKSWDCPLHGSRFDGCGHILNGPSLDKLHCSKRPENL